MNICLFPLGFFRKDPTTTQEVPVQKHFPQSLWRSSHAQPVNSTERKLLCQRRCNHANRFVLKIRSQLNQGTKAGFLASTSHSANNTSRSCRTEGNATKHELQKMAQANKQQYGTWISQRGPRPHRQFTVRRGITRPTEVKDTYVHRLYLTDRS